MKMKVLFITEYFPPETKGGGEISCFLLAKHLAKLGIEVHVLTSKFKKNIRLEKVNGIYIHRLLKTGESPSSILSNIKRGLFFSKSVEKKTKLLLKKYKFDLIHYFNITSIGGIIQAKIPKIMHINSQVLFCPKGDLLYCGGRQCEKQCNYKIFKKCFINSDYLGKMKNHFFLKNNPLFRKYLYNIYSKRLKKIKEIDLFMPISNYFAKRLELNGINENKISVIPNIVEVKNFRINEVNTKEELKIIYLGSYTKYKGILVLLEALKNTKRKYSCNLYGSGVLENEIKQKIRKEKLNVTINKEVKYKEIPHILSKHNAIILPSILPEAFGRVLVEGMAAGLIPIGSNIGGIPDVIKNKKGHLFTPGDPKDLVKIFNSLKEIKKSELINESKKYEGEKIAKIVLEEYKKLK
jgi:glycosyltransferase involved in cell wall biosynthesis